MQINRKVVVGNIMWRFMERIGAQGVKLIVEIVLARLLLPDDYGIIALVTVFINILNVFVDSGLGTSLVQKKDADQLDFSTVFWFNFFWCIILYFLLFLTAPIIAEFYRMAELIPVIRVLGIQIIVSGVKNVQQAYVSKTLQFKRFFFATLGGTIGAAFVGIAMAYKGYGVWALVGQQLFNVCVDTIILWITVGWRPEFVFSLSRLKKLFSFGWKLLLSSLIDKVYNDLRQLIIGKYYASADLAQYNRGKQFPYLFISNVNKSIDSVLLPAMSKEQDDVARLRTLTRRSISTSTYVIAPLMMGLAFAGDQIVEIFLTAKWLPCVPYMRIFCITYMFYPIHAANLNAIKAIGRSDLYLKLEIIKKVVGLAAIFLTMKISVMAMAYSLLITSVISQVINSWPNRKLLNYRYIDQLKDISPSVLLAVFMGICIGLMNFLHLPGILTLLIRIIVGTGIYIMGSMVFKIEAFSYLLDMARSYVRKKGH